MGSLKIDLPDYQEVLNQISRTLLHLQQPKRLLKLVTRFIDRRYHLSHTSFLALDQKKQRFTFIDSQGMRRFPVKLIKFDMDHPFIRAFEGSPRARQKRRYVSLREVQSVHGEGSPKDPLDVSLLGSMNLFKVELLVPAYDGKYLIGILMLGKKKTGGEYQPVEIEFFSSLAQTCSLAIRVARYHEDLAIKNIQLKQSLLEIGGLRRKEKDTYRQILRALIREMDTKDPYAKDHISMVEQLGMLIAKEMGVLKTEEDKDRMQAALILHDVGKIGVPDGILTKVGKLTDAEWELMKGHVKKGVRILEPLETFRQVAEIIRCHHEHYNGKGYPQGLSGEQIPVEARIIAVVDAFDAMISKRSYNEPRRDEDALAELKRCAGTQFDPKIVDIFIKSYTKRRPPADLPFEADFLEKTPVAEKK